MTMRAGFRVRTSTLFLTLVLILTLTVGGAIGWVGYSLSRDILERTGHDLNKRINGELLADLRQMLNPVEMATQLVSYDQLGHVKTLKERLERLPAFKAALDSVPTLSSIYVGYDSGDFFMMRDLHDGIENFNIKVPKDARFIVQSLEHNIHLPRKVTIYLDDDLNILYEDDRVDHVSWYDPREREWFKSTLGSPALIHTGPYVFFANRKVGMTFSKRSVDGVSTVGTDVQLDKLSKQLKLEKITPHSQLALVNIDGAVVAYEDESRLVTTSDAANAVPKLAHLKALGVPVLEKIAREMQIMEGVGANISPFKAMFERIQKEKLEEPPQMRFSLDGEVWRASILTLMVDNNPLFLVSAVPEWELLAEAFDLRRNSIVIVILIILVAVPVSWGLARLVSNSLRQLAREAERIRRFDFSKPVKSGAILKEVHDLAFTMDRMKSAIRRFLDISMVIATENDLDRLLPRMLNEFFAIVRAKGGVLYLSTAEGLDPACMQSLDGKPLQGSNSIRFLTVQETQTKEDWVLQAGPLMGEALKEGKVTEGCLLAEDIASLGLEEVIDAFSSEQKEVHAIAVPLMNRKRHLVGAILLFTEGEPGDTGRLSFITALSGTAAVTLETRELLKAQKELFEAFIQVLAGAIDAKSPYTGKHCGRVPDITKMLARAACRQTTGRYKDFQLSNEEWEAVHIAAWLHDCGKVTTPEYVIDKATKLETIYDRIHEIRMRFEVLKCEAQITCLKAIADGQNEAEAKAELKIALQELDDEFTFIAKCNEGTEFMEREKIERLKKIAARTWTRTLDDRIGISYDERQRKGRAIASSLPAKEPLLADRVEHLFERSGLECAVSGERMGFKMDVPALLYNKGELYNLSVERGTLSAEERYKINEHIIQTQIMLSKLPFPKHLASVPEIAGGHHEKIDGTGYPKGLTKEQMSPVARMMAIADIFEALTSVDRPYKKMKTLSEAIAIMAGMRDRYHIDAELFDIFLQEGVFLEYAKQYMRPEQIDTVDIDAFLSTSHQI